MELFDKEDLNREDKITWSAYHAVREMLPLFYEKASTPAMIKHGMDVLKIAIKFLNPAQIKVMAVDLPLFALAKMVQWKWLDTHGEDKYVLMFGGFHSEMALQSTLGDLLEGSGWTTALVVAEIASSGVAESFLKTSHLTRTR